MKAAKEVSGSFKPLLLTLTILVHPKGSGPLEVFCSSNAFSLQETYPLYSSVHMDV